MRKITVFFLLVSLFLGVSLGYAKIKEDGLEGTISISGAWALYPMVVKWAEEFQKIHPKVKIDLAAGGAGKGMADALGGVVDIGMVSREIQPVEIYKGAYGIAVTKDAVVPTINENNPALKELLSKGAKKDTFVAIWISGAVKNWNEVCATKIAQPIHVYTRSDACGAAETWAKFLDNKKQEDLQGVGVYGDPGLTEAIRKDALGIGYNNINYAYDTSTKKQISGIRILPIDVNADGKITEDEDFYGTREKIIEAINAGRYPSPPARDLYFVTRNKPKRKVVIEFIKWVIGDGQKYVPEAGYINLSADKIKEELKKL